MFCSYFFNLFILWTLWYLKCAFVMTICSFPNKQIFVNLQLHTIIIRNVPQDLSQHKDTSTLQLVSSEISLHCTDSQWNLKHEFVKGNFFPITVNLYDWFSEGLNLSFLYLLLTVSFKLNNQGERSIVWNNRDGPKWRWSFIKCLTEAFSCLHWV